MALDMGKIYRHIRVKDISFRIFFGFYRKCCNFAGYGFIPPYKLSLGGIEYRKII